MYTQHFIWAALKEAVVVVFVSHHHHRFPIIQQQLSRKKVSNSKLRLHYVIIDLIHIFLAFFGACGNGLFWGENKGLGNGRRA
jgi:hypothetical protein